MTRKTLGDFIDTRGTGKSVDKSELRKSAAEAISPRATAVASEEVYEKEARDFYSKLRFKSEADVNAMFALEDDLRNFNGESGTRDVLSSDSKFSGAKIKGLDDQGIKISQGDLQRSSILKDYFESLKLPNDKPTGEYLDPSSEIKQESDIVVSGLLQALKDSNRFTPGSNTPFIQEIGGVKRITKDIHHVYDAASLTRAQDGGLDSTTPNAFGRYQSIFSEIKSLPLVDIQRMAISNLAGATGVETFFTRKPFNKDGDYPSDDFLDEVKRGFDKVTGGVIPNLPLVSQGEWKIPVSTMGISSFSLIDRNGDGGEIGDDREDYGSSDPMNNKSFGVMNFPGGHFKEPFNFGMLWPALLSLIFLFVILYAFQLLWEAFGAIRRLMSGSFLDPEDSQLDEDTEHLPDPKYELDAMAMGSRHTPDSKSDALEALFDMLYAALDWPRWTRFGFFANAFRGLLMFMGFGVQAHKSIWVPDVEPQSAVQALIELMKNPGYYVVVLKQVFREISNIAAGFGSFSAANFAAFVSSLIGLFDAIRESATWRFILILSDLGEQAARATMLRAKAPWIGQAGAVAKLAEGKNYASDVIEDVSNYRHLNRVKTKSSSPSRSALSIHMFRSVILSGQPYGSTAGTEQLIDLTKLTDISAEVGDAKSDIIKVGPTKEADAQLTRIPKELVEKYEKQLSAEYCPFYIQDLRNNEIIQLPAFITQLNDNFAAEYNASSGFGRTDAVKTYSKTQRSIQIGVKLVAMSKEDHSHMWFVINRLISMLYPQRSLGRIKNVPGGGTKLQPFSQVPTSSPMVRLRLGDLYRSNYTDSAFAKMLGFPGYLNPPGDGDKNIFSDDEMKKLQVFGSTIPLKLRKAKQKLIDEFNEVMKKKESSATDKVEAVKKLAESSDKNPWGGHILLKPGMPIYLRGYKPPNPLDMLGDLLGGGDGDEKVGNADFEIKNLIYAKPLAAKAKDEAAYICAQTNVFNPQENSDLKELVKIMNDYYDVPDESRMGFGAKDSSKKISKADARLYAFNHNKNKFFVSNKKQMMRLQDICKDSTSTVVESIAKIIKKDSEYKIVCCFEAGKTEKYAVVPSIQKIYDTMDNQEVAKILKKSATGDEGKNLQKIREFIQNDDMYKFFKETSGYGLAGFITQMSLDYGDSTWEIDQGSKAPKKVELTLSFDPIHDLTPGIDNSGRMQNPVFPVGEYSGGDLDPWTKDISSYSMFEQAKTMIVDATGDNPVPEPEPPGFPGNLL